MIRFCYARRDFKRMYEFCIYAMMDAIEYHRKLYNQFLEESRTANGKTVPIGFTHSTLSKEPRETNETKNLHRRIGFV